MVKKEETNSRLKIRWLCSAHALLSKTIFEVFRRLFGNANSFSFWEALEPLGVYPQRGRFHHHHPIHDKRNPSQNPRRATMSTHAHLSTPDPEWINSFDNTPLPNSDGVDPNVIRAFASKARIEAMAKLGPCELITYVVEEVNDMNIVLSDGGRTYYYKSRITSTQWNRSIKTIYPRTRTFGRE